MSKSITELKDKVDLLSLVESKHKVKPVGQDRYRVNPCPVCGSKDHFTIYTNTNSYSSFNDCCQGGSPYDYLMEVEGMSEEEAYQELKRLSGNDDLGYKRDKAAKKKGSTNPMPTKAKDKVKPFNKYTNSILELYNKQTEKQRQYFIDRGISNAAIDKYKLVVGDIRKLGSRGYGERAIIPIWRNGEVIAWNSRAIEDNPKIKYIKSPGSAALFNGDYLESAKPGETIILTEGEIDALSLESIGYKALALGGVANYKTVIENLTRDDLVLITAFDNDKSGQEVKSEKKITIPSEYNDINDWIVADRENFSSSIKEQIQGINRPNNLYKYMSSQFGLDIESHSKFKDRKTGFKNLDSKTSLYPGLYVIGGVSTLGKTTFTHQLADQMAEQGEHILFFSLEQSTLELMTKSIARLSAVDDRGLYIPGKGVSSLDVRMKSTKGKEAAVQKAILDYAATSKRFNIIEGNFNTDINYIRSYTEAYIRRNKTKPIVIIDYLQIMPGDDQAWSDKDKLDRTVTGLKQLSRDYNITVIVVSSFNRTNYLAPVDFESFNGSGNIEYTADVVWGLQLAVIHDEIFDKNNNIKEKREKITKAKKAIPREVELVALKNRNGISNYSCNFLYYPQHDLFISQEDKEDYPKLKQSSRRL